MILMTEQVVTLDQFKPRPYQVPIFKAIEEGYKRGIVIWPRRAGKDLVCFNILLRQAIKKIGIYYYIFPSYSQARKALFDTMTNDGKRMIEFIPAPLIASTNIAEMKISLINGSIIQCIGAMNWNSLMGTNPCGIVYSEAALMESNNCYKFLSPILQANNGWCLLASTPRARNWFHDMYVIAQHNPDVWFTSKLTIEDTKHIPIEVIEAEITRGDISRSFANQEYWTSFSEGIEGGWYNHYLEQMRINNQLTGVPHLGEYKTHTSWDLGIRDQTSVIFLQLIDHKIHIIDYYENTDMGLEHYVHYLKTKPYVYGHHIAPHDIKVREFGTGMTRLDKARNLGIDFTIADNIPFIDGIEAVRSTLPRIWIDQVRCKRLISALESYRKAKDESTNTYKSTPIHDIHSHPMDALRYLCISLSKIKESMSSQDIDKAFHEARYGNQSNLPFPFNQSTTKFY